MICRKPRLLSGLSLVMFIKPSAYDAPSDLTPPATNATTRSRRKAEQVDDDDESFHILVEFCEFLTTFI